LENLESRLVPTIVFQPQFGVETLTPQSTNDGMQHPTVHLIFAGDPSGGVYYWKTPQGQADETRLTDLAAALLGGPYLTGLPEYGSDGLANLGVAWTGAPDLPTDAVAKSPNHADLQTYITNEIETEVPMNPKADPGNLDWQHAPIYVVILDPTTSQQAGHGGWNTPGYGPNGVRIHMIWVATYPRTNGNPGVQSDAFTLALGHALAETISDPDSAGIRVISPEPSWVAIGPGTGQICDFEAESGADEYRLADSILVAAYWSVKHQAFIVPDGNRQDFEVRPVWDLLNQKFTHTADLTILGDQPPFNGNDTIVIEAVGAGGKGVRAVMNGEAAQIPYAVRTVYVYPGNGNNSVQVDAVPQGTTIDVIDSGFLSSDDVSVGLLGSKVVGLAAILGTVNVSGAPQKGEHTYLTVDALNDGPQSIAITDKEVAFQRGPVIHYQNVAALYLIDGNGQNHIDVESVAASTGLAISADQQDVIYGPAVGKAHIKRR
jgi:hypothetical protein